MWVFYGLLPTLLILAIIIGGVVLLVRRGSEGWSIQFPGVLLAYVATAMLIGVFLVAAGAGLLLKAGFAQAGERDFSYDVQPYPRYEPYPAYAPYEPTPVPVEPAQMVDPSDNAIRDDVARGISLTFAGTVLFAVHAWAPWCCDAARRRARSSFRARTILWGWR